MTPNGDTAFPSLLLSLALVPASALAQGLDAHGPVAPPTDGSPDAPLLLLDPDLPDPGMFAVGVLGTYADAPYVRYTCDPDCVPVYTRLDNVVGADLQLGYGVHPRVAALVSMPVFFASTGDVGGGGFAPGDLHLWVPIAIVPAEDNGLALAFAPMASLPTGDTDRFLGQSGVVAGGIATAHYRRGPLAGTLNTGLQLRPPATAIGSPGGLAMTNAASLTVMPLDWLGLHLEGRYDLPFYTDPDDVVGRPGELAGGVRGRIASGLWWMAGGGTGISTGIGNPNWRAFGGVGFSPPKPVMPAVLEPEPVTVRALDPNGNPVRGANVLVGDEVVGSTDAEGRVVLVASTRWRQGVRVEAPGLMAATVAEPAAGVTAADVTLGWAPVPFVLRVVDQAGRPLPAEVTLDGPAEIAAPTTDDRGRQVWSLPQGTWEVRISAPGFGRQRRDVIVPPGRRQPIYVEAVLAPDLGGTAEMVLTVTDEEGVPVEGALVSLDGTLIGTTATGGTVVVSGVKEGTHDLRVASDVYAHVEQSRVELTEAAKPLEVAMPYRDGSVRVSVRSSQGAPVDAVVRFDGPARIPSSPLGEDGRRVFVLRPGEWRLLVSSPTLGLQERALVVPDFAKDVIDVEIVLQAEERGEADVLVRVVDPQGAPVVGAEVVVDGRSYGKTTTGGTLRLAGLEPGQRRLLARGERFLEAPESVLSVSPGYQEALLPLGWKPGTVQVRAQTPDGAPIDAVVRAAGPGDVAAFSLGDDGRELIGLLPGRWSMLASSPAHGLQSRDVEVDPASHELIDIPLVMAAAGGQAQLAVQVHGPDGEPVDGARVFVNGTPYGATSTSGLLRIEGLAPGPAKIEVAAPAYAPVTITGVKLANKQLESRDVKLDWAAGALKVVTRSAEGPVTDALVAVAGAMVLPPKQVGSDGSRTFGLTPGTWHVLVSSPRYGMVERLVEISEDTVGLRTEEILLSPSSSAQAADLLVRVVDPDGKPIPGAEVRINGEAKGKTSAGGTLLTAGLKPGPIQVAVTAPHMKPADVLELDLPAGPLAKFVTLDWEPQDVDVLARDASGAPIDAELTLEGPEGALLVQRTGGDGHETLRLRPGRWSIIAKAPKYGARRQEVVLEAGAASKRVVFDLQAAMAERTGSSLTILEKVHFALDQAQVTSREDVLLAEVANLLLSDPSIVTVEVQGHTDATGDVAYNMALSERRAIAVRDRLIFHGVPPERLVARGYGPLQPIADDSTDEGRAKNRRVEFLVVETAAEAGGTAVTTP